MGGGRVEERRYIFIEMYSKIFCEREVGIKIILLNTIWGEVHVSK